MSFPIKELADLRWFYPEKMCLVDQAINPKCLKEAPNKEERMPFVNRETAPFASVSLKGRREALRHLGFKKSRHV